jgi:hypothetical protein
LKNVIDDSADALIEEYEKNQSILREKLGAKEFDEMMELLKELKKDEEKKGKFQAVEGDIDTRGSEKKDVNLPTGFNVDCGLKGCKLSGG